MAGSPKREPEGSLLAAFAGPELVGVQSRKKDFTGKHVGPEKSRKTITEQHGKQLYDMYFSSGCKNGAQKL